MYTIYLDRLIQNANIDFSKGFCWDGHYIKENDVLDYISSGGKGTQEAYGDTFRYPVKSPKDKIYHVSRVAWFVLHPEEIKGIEIDNAVTYDGKAILPNALVVDGWHRLLAAKIANVEKIKVFYGGRMDILNYLQGKRKTEPTRLV